MGKKGVVSETRWIDLTQLPRMYGGNRSDIDWSKSTGYVLSYRYDDINGNINIIDTVYRNKSGGKRKAALIITIDKYVPTPIEIDSSILIRCRLYQYVKNKIVDKAPQLIQYLTNPEDAYKYTYNSGKYVSTTCPICGHTENKSVTNLYCAGYFCPCCSDNISLPNKMMRAVLQQLDVDYTPEADRQNGFDWIPNRYRYDFYFRSSVGQDVLVEMDGFFHELEEQQKKDEIKTRLAAENNFRLIRVDCRYKDHFPFDYIKERIINSELSSILPLNLVDWDECKKVMKTSLIVAACELWEKDKLTVSKITEQLKLGHATVVRYLKIGRNFGLCPSYNVEAAFQRRDEDKYKPILVIDKINNQYVFISTHEAIDSFFTIFGIRASKSGLNTACRCHGVYKGLRVKYITKEEYEQHKMINNNEVVLKEAI